MGTGEWTTVPMARTGRHYFAAALGPVAGALEYALEAAGAAATWPPGGRNNAHTVIPI